MNLERQIELLDRLLQIHREESAHPRGSFDREVIKLIVRIVGIIDHSLQEIND